MRNVQKQQQFKRANSMPNIVKKSAMKRSSNLLSSQSDLSQAQTEPVEVSFLEILIFLFRI